MMTIEEARGLAAQAWCAPETQTRIMDPALAEEFAKILIRETAKAAADAVLEAAGVPPSQPAPSPNPYTGKPREPGCSCGTGNDCPVCS